MNEYLTLTNDNMENKELTIQTEQPQALAPMTPEAAKAMMLMYQEYQKSLLDESDYQAIQGKDFKKKSAWRKLAMANNLSVRVVDERREELPHGDYAYHFVCEATHPNGRVTSGSGSCTAYEKAVIQDGKWFVKGYPAQPNSLHNIRSTAETRAWNRAVSNMIAAGEVSAEEVDQGQHNTVTTQQKPVSAPIITQQAQPVVVTPTQSNDEEPRCEKCNGAMWDCRTREAGGKGNYPKTNPAAPDWKCKDKNCGGAIWLQDDRPWAQPSDDSLPEITVDDIPF